MKLKIIANKNESDESDISFLIGKEFEINIIDIKEGNLDTYITFGGSKLFNIHPDEYEIVDGNLGNTEIENYDYIKDKDM